MSRKNKKSLIPEYQGSKWIRSGLPRESECWQPGKRRVQTNGECSAAITKALRRAASHQPWQWPKHPVYFFADPHADAEAFSASLVASGGVKKTGPDIIDFKLTDAGHKAVFVIGGDCLDKGPDNLQLLDTIRKLKTTGAKVKLLAGNHDVRLFIGIRALEMERDPRTEHLFLRMGPKVIPLLKEVHDRYLAGKKLPASIPRNRDCRRMLYPSKRWFSAFPREAVWVMPEQTIERELVRIRKKMDVFENACNEAGMSMRDVYAAALKIRDLFLEPGGKYYWFFHDMQLLYRSGSILFIHAGLDDRIASTIETEGFAYLNRLYHKQLKHDMFEFYYGPLANTMRTKYRSIHMPLTTRGVERVYRQGVHAVVHGHRNVTHGQRIMLRQGLIHIESDITMDRNSRKKEGLDGYGVGVTIVRPQGQIVGISTDHPYAKVFEPEKLLK